LLGRHKAGRLKQATVVKATRKEFDEFDEWETKNQASLRKLDWLLVAMVRGAR
jgi:hypothetical protein